jgi:uncharacterized protein
LAALPESFMKGLYSLICGMKGENLIVQKTATFIQEKFRGESSGHDWWHVYRVWQNALTIAGNEPGANQLVVELAALLHDVADWKFHGGDEAAGPREARRWLEEQEVVPEVVDQVCVIIDGVTYKGAGVATPMETLEGKIVQDADRLDAIGAIGIARAFAYGGHKGRSLYEPDQAPETHHSFAAYQKNAGPTINHFYEKLLLLKDRMHTATGKAMAEKRHRYLEGFLDQFFREWEGQ